MRDDASENTTVHGPIIRYNSLDPIVIIETTAIVITETQKAERRHQRIKGSSFIYHKVSNKCTGFSYTTSHVKIAEIFRERNKMLINEWKRM